MTMTSLFGFQRKVFYFFVVRFKMVPLKNLFDGFTLFIQYTVPKENGIPDQVSSLIITRKLIEFLRKFKFE